jgi:cytochrome c-type biogenesis protein CcmH/NrfG
MMNLQYPALIAEARRLLANHEFSRCYETCQHLLQLRKNDPETLMILASIDFTGGHRDMAIDKMRRFVRLYPKNIDGRNYLAFMLDDTGRMREAVVQYDKVLRRDPDNAEALAGKARALDRDGQPDRAMALLEKRLSKGTLTPAMALVYATCAMNRKDYDRAVEIALPHAENHTAATCDPPPGCGTSSASHTSGWTGSRNRSTPTSTPTRLAPRRTIPMRSIARSMS